MFGPAALFAILWATLDGRATAGRDSGYDSQSPICRLAIPHVTIPITRSGRRDPTGHAFADHYPELVLDLRQRRYARATRYMEQYDAYEPGNADGEYPVASELLFERRFHDSFVALYHEDFCSTETPIDPRASDSGVEVLFDRALTNAVDGDLATARTLAREAYRRDPRFGEALLLAGEIDIALGDRAAARSDWLRAAVGSSYAFSDDSFGGHAGFPIDAVTYLLRFRP